MKFTIKLFLILVIAASTIFADGDMTNGGYNDDGDMTNGGKTCTQNCPTPTPGMQSGNGTNTQTTDENEDDSILTEIENYLSSLFR